MKTLRALFTEHPATVGETYFEHMGQALGFSARMLAGGLCCLVHAFLPFLFLRTGSRFIAELNERMVVNRDRRASATLPARAEGPVTSLTTPANTAG